MRPRPSPGEGYGLPCHRRAARADTGPDTRVLGRPGWRSLARSEGAEASGDREPERAIVALGRVLADVPLAAHLPC